MAENTGGGRTVADLMSAPVVTATAGETVADGGERMSDKKVGSVVVVDADRPVGILTERDLVRIAARRRRHRHRDACGEWMTPEPRLRRARRRRRRAAFASLAEHGYRHIPVVDDDALVGIVSMRDLMRIAPDPAGREARPRGPARARGRRRRRDDDRRRPRPRRLLPLPPVQRRRARREAHARGRLVPDVRGRAARRRRSARSSWPRSRRCARSRPRSRSRCPSSPGLGLDTSARSTCCAPRCRCSALTSGSAVWLDIGDDELRAQAHADLRGACRRCSPRSTGCSTASSRSTRTPTSRTRRTTST